MPESKSPFDDDSDPSTPAPTRRRRPWWRWNIVVLFIGLFLMVWVRELFKLSPGATWASVISLFGVWVIVPAFFVEGKFTRTLQSTSSSGVPLPTTTPTPRWETHMLKALQVFALIAIAISAAHLLITLAWIVYAVMGTSGGWYARRGVRMVEAWGIWGVVVAPMFEVLLSGCLFCLSVIAARLSPGQHEAQRRAD